MLALNNENLNEYYFSMNIPVFQHVMTVNRPGLSIACNNTLIVLANKFVFSPFNVDSTEQNKIMNNISFDQLFILSITIYCLYQNGSK